MVFALSTDDRTLHIFADVETAVSYAEGVDVEDGGWLFFSEEGWRLEPVFITPNRRGRIAVVSGRYTLQPRTGHSAGLLDHLRGVAAVDGPTGLNTVEAVRERLASGGNRSRGGGA